MQCRISRLRKYLEFFSPSLCHRDLDLKIVSFVSYSISISCSRLFLSNFIRKSLRLFAEVLATCSSRIFIEFSMSSFFCIVFLFFDFLWLIDASLVFIFIISHNSPGVTECYLTGEYSSLVGVIAALIWFTHSSSLKKDVFNFQKPFLESYCEEIIASDH